MGNQIIEIVDDRTSYFRMKKLAEMVKEKCRQGFPMIYIAYMNRIDEVFLPEYVLVVKNIEDVIKHLRDAQLGRVILNQIFRTHNRPIAIIFDDDPEIQIQQTIALLHQCNTIRPLGIAIESMTTIQRDVNSPESRIVSLLLSLHDSGVWVAYTTKESVKQKGRCQCIESISVTAADRERYMKKQFDAEQQKENYEKITECQKYSDKSSELKKG